MQKIKISVVITIYKVEDYLCQCIESVLSSSYKEIEVILVDDGSPDSCPEICDKYAKIDSRIKVIHQENKGSVTARKNGVLASSGQYISIIDGDDWVSPELYESIYEMLQNQKFDILFMGYNEFDSGKLISKSNSIKNGIYEGDNLKEFKSKSLNNGLFYTPGIVPSLWSKVFQRELLIDIFAIVPSKLKMGDDAAVSYSAIATASRVLVCNNINGYIYRIRNESLSRSFDDLYFDRAKFLKEFLYGVFRKYNEKAMIENLSYYNLFIFEVGVGSYLYNYKTNGILLTSKKIKSGSKVMNTKSDWKSVDKNVFSKDDIWRLRNLSNGHIYRYFIRMALIKIKESIDSFF